MKRTGRVVDSGDHDSKLRRNQLVGRHQLLYMPMLHCITLSDPYCFQHHQLT
jgi:hypothetical protein